MPISVRRLLTVLRKEYGEPHWWPGESPFEIAVGAILTQNTAWNNAAKSISNLKHEGLLSPRTMLRSDSVELERAISPSGFHRRKTEYLLTFAAHIQTRYGGDMGRMRRMPTKRLRDELLGLRGIGQETADSILLYSLDKPSFVVDAYTKRLLVRLGIDFGDCYESIQSAFEVTLRRKVEDYKDLHALIVIHCKEMCRKSRQCHTKTCVIARFCPSVKS